MKSKEDIFAKEVIKNIAVGKRGSRNLDQEQTSKLIISFNQLSRVHKVVILSALRFKGPSEIEQQFIDSLDFKFDHNVSFIDKLISIPDDLKGIYYDLLDNNTLVDKDANDLSKYLFDLKSDPAAKALAATILRIRYTEINEYVALATAIQNTFNENLVKNPPAGLPILFWSEPFDGLDHSFFISQLVAYLLSDRYRSVHLVGRSSGPKYGINALNIMQALRAENLATELLDSSQLSNHMNSCGYYIAQDKLSESLDSWVEIRHEMVKRPFLATVEKLVKPFDPDYLITSAFHGNFSEKTIKVAELTGFRKIILLRKGREGSLTYSLSKSNEIFLSKRVNNKFKNKNFEISHENKDKNKDIDKNKDDRIDISTDKMLILIREYINNKQSSDTKFNQYVEFALRNILLSINEVDKL